jgi:hypothetical protein
MGETVTTPYEQCATTAVRLLEANERHSCDQALIEELFVCTALVANEQRSVDLATILEFIDSREHLMMTAEEVAGGIEFLLSRKLITRDAQRLTIPDDIWRSLPRKRGKLDASAAGRSRWRDLLKTQA